MILQLSMNYLARFKKDNIKQSHGIKITCVGSKINGWNQ